MCEVYNCIICATEFSLPEEDNSTYYIINKTNYKICKLCFETSDPSSDYKEVKNIILSYNSLAKNKKFAKQIRNILKSSI